jgi:flavin-dependent dehydrogenase
MKRLRFDVCVIGGGPAGAAIARRLVQLGHSVVVLQKTRYPRPHKSESLGAAVLPLLELLGIRESIENAGFLLAKRKLLLWGINDCESVEMSETTFQIDRTYFDDLLLKTARLAGAAVFEPSRVMGLQQLEEGDWKIDVQTTDTSVSIFARFLADASGRNCFTGGRKARASTPTLAISGEWKGVFAAANETRIEAGDDTWYWALPTGAGTFSATAFVDAGCYAPAVSKAGSRLNFYLDLLARSRLLRGCLQAELVSQPRVQDATCYRDTDPAVARRICIGDAAFTIDPLSSQGVVDAIGSALHAATVLHTIFLRPADTDIALAFYRNRTQLSYRFHSQAAADYYNRAMTFRPSAFWTRRAERRIPARVRRTSVDLALNDLVELSPDVRFGPVPVVSGNFVTTALGVFAPACQEGAVFLGSIALAPRLSEMGELKTVSAVLERWRNFMPARHTADLLRWTIENELVHRSSKYSDSKLSS